MLAAVGVFLAVVVYLVIVDLGVNAGRIHYGVSVEDIDVGGMTPPQAVQRLTERGKLLKKNEISFGAPGVHCAFVPGQIGWGPQPADTTKVALEVGRGGAPFGALADRVRAWLGGVTVEWADAPDQDAVDDVYEECQTSASGQDLEIDREAFDELVRRAIVTWPRPVSFRLPLRAPAI